MMTKKEKKRVPELRFPEFEGEWEEKKLEHLSKYVKSGNSKGCDNGIYDLYGSTGIIGRTNNCIDEGSYLLVARVGANAGQINSVDGRFGVSDNTLIVSLKENVSLVFIKNFLIQFDLNRLIYGSGQPLVTGTLLKKIKIHIPKLEEQQKIASFLTSIDTRIQQLEKKRTLLQQYKKGVMQQIFKQEIRFKTDDGKEFPKWEKKKLGDVAKITTGSSNRQDSSLTGAYTFFDRSMDIRTSSIYLFEGEAVIVAGEGSDFIPKYFVGKFDLHQRTYAIMDYIGASGKFIYYYIYYHRNYFLSQAVGSTVKSLRLPMFQKMPITLPSLPEQTKIAHFLSAIDKKIAAIDEQIAGTKEWKKGLLQRMFV